MIAAGVSDIACCIEVMDESLVLLADGDSMMAGDRGDAPGRYCPSLHSHGCVPG